MSGNLSTYLKEGALLTRWYMGNADECGTVAFWQEHISQLYAQMPFPDLWRRVKLNVWHMDHPEQDNRVQRGQWCLEDYQPGTPGYQVADGLTATEIDLALFPDGWQPGVYTGPARPLTDEARNHSRLALSHEFGHFHQFACRYDGSDDIAKHIKRCFQQLRPHQAAGDNEYEDWAETYRAILGADPCRGFFSDNKPFKPSPELYSLLRCAYWLQSNLANLPVQNCTPQAFGVMYCALINGVNRWRFIDLNWRGQEWVPPANGKAEYWKPI